MAWLFQHVPEKDFGICARAGTGLEPTDGLFQCGFGGKAAGNLLNEIGTAGFVSREPGYCDNLLVLLLFIHFTMAILTICR